MITATWTSWLLYGAPQRLTASAADKFPPAPDGATTGGDLADALGTSARLWMNLQATWACIRRSGGAMRHSTARAFKTAELHLTRSAASFSRLSRNLLWRDFTKTLGARDRT
jgi:hypothetical protein